MTVRKKHCPGCRSEKPISNFHRYKRSSDGRTWICKACVKQRQRDYYIKYPDRVLNRNRRWAHVNQEAKKEINKAWRLRNKKRLRELGKIWNLKNKEKLREIHRRHRAKYPERHLGYKLKTFGLTVERYKQILSSQNGVCVGCLTPPKTRLPVDHDHKTGLVRGLLCCNCNFSIGHAKDSPEVLRRLADYLEKQKGGVSV